ncbi:dihydrofolate reductase family protein [Ciceribacter ferrooxidans]|uniref:Dihydrofolate reductase n=1 Tax=Ciceribacter ferrooxidans TaxID=2509717 RepID=A0A4Q2TSU4_9HYPH|nr:dihydrofolate reductase family protein [Ciceribacter ferrooxidans]RYC23947.1 dihydrofolate reductase [Ciceribacter ferrooxidans]
MRKLRILEQISIDGVVQAPGGPDEDRDGDFEHGGWAMLYSSPEVRETISALHGRPFDLLLGRRTYDIWAPFWPKQTGPLADGLNAATKYVATHRPDSLTWGPVEDLGADIAEGVRRAKTRDGPDLILWGSSTLPSVLLENDLVDEVLLFVFPILLGRGKRIAPAGADPRSLALVSSKPASSGVLINTYRPVGPLRA